MRKALMTLTSFFFILTFIFVSHCPGVEKTKRVALVVYDDLTKDYGVALANLLGHFFMKYRTELKHILKVSPAQIIKSDVFFILSSYDSEFPPLPILKAINVRIRNPEKVTCLMGTPPWLDRSDKYKVFTYVSYKGWKYRGDYGIYPLKIKRGSPTAMLESGGGGETAPLILNDGNLWIVQGFPLFDVHSWIFADTLHDILKVYHKSKKAVFLRLEDVNPSYGDAELKKLDDCISYLHNQGIPFTIAVYPVFINYKEGEAITLLQNEKLVVLLRKAEKMGGSIIMHGTSHQYREVSGEGSEFWDMLRDKPLPNEKEYFHRRMQYGLWLFRKAGLTPLFFESPHYNLPPTLQLEMHKYFTTILGELMINNRTYKTTQTIPFIVYRTCTGLTLLPEQLGYIAAEDRIASIRRIKERALELEHIVRDPMVCFFYHPYLDGDKPLRELIPFFRDEGFRFINVAIYGSPTKFKVRKVPHLWKIKEKRTFYFGTTPAFLAVTSALVLLSIYLRLSSRRKRRLFESDRTS